MSLPQHSPTSFLSADEELADAQRYRRLLHELMDIGMELARDLRRVPADGAAADGAAADAAPRGADPEAAMVFDRVSRAVRRTVMLARVVSQPAPPPMQPGAARGEARMKRAARGAEGWRSGGVDLSKLSDEELDRLEAADRLAELDGRPIDEVIAEIRRDFGLSGAGPARDAARLAEAGVLSAGRWEESCAREDGTGAAPDCGARFRGG